MTARAEIVVRLAKVVEIVLNDLDLTVNQYRMLSLVGDAPLSMGALSTRLAMKPPNVTTLVDNLVDRDLVVRKQRTGDRRRVALSLTASGRALLRKASSRCDDALTRLATLDDREAELRLESLDLWLPVLDEAARRLDEG